MSRVPGAVIEAIESSPHPQSWVRKLVEAIYDNPPIGGDAPPPPDPIDAARLFRAAITHV